METPHIEGKHVPHVIFKTRVHDASITPNPYRWQDVSSEELFNGKKVVVFAVPGAFTPTCSSFHLPGYEGLYEELKKCGVDEVYCLAVNDAFVLWHWKNELEIKNVKFIPDGSVHFTRALGMVVRKDDVGFGERSWRYSMLVKNGIIEKVFIEDGMCDNCDNEPFSVSDAQTMLTYLQNNHN